jgi:hypothetical protein
MAVLHMLTGIAVGSGIGYHFGTAHGKSLALIALLRLRHEHPKANLDTAVTVAAQS